MSLPSVTPAEAHRLLKAGAVLIDIRRADEHARERIPGAQNRPADSLARLHSMSQPIVFHCASGLRTQIHAAKLAAASDGNAFVLEGGLEAWKKEGLPVVSGAQECGLMTASELCAA
jgi:rhodanese-related sulfurtransferase